MYITIIVEFYFLSCSLGVFDMETIPNEVGKEESMDDTMKTKRSNSLSIQKNVRVYILISKMSQVNLMH